MQASPACIACDVAACRSSAGSAATSATKRSVPDDAQQTTLRSASRGGACPRPRDAIDGPRRRPVTHSVTTSRGGRGGSSPPQATTGTNAASLAGAPKDVQACAQRALPSQHCPSHRCLLLRLLQRRLSLRLRRQRRGSCGAEGGCRRCRPCCKRWRREASGGCKCAAAEQRSARECNARHRREHGRLPLLCL